MMKLIPYRLDLMAMSEQEWQDLLAVQLAVYRETSPNEEPPSVEAFRGFVERVPAFPDDVFYWLLYDPAGTPIGLCIMQHPKPDHPNYETNKTRIYVEPHILAPYQRQGFGVQLLSTIVEFANEREAEWIQWDCSMQSGINFSTKIGAIEAGRQQTNRLAIANVDWNLMQAWTDSGAQRNSEVQLYRFVNLPKETLITPFCNLVTAINLLQPRDEVEGMDFALTPDALRETAEMNEETGVERIVYCTVEPDQTLSGMTDFVYHKSNPEQVKVMLTGVQRDYQGRGLGKWLKSAIMFDLKDAYPAVAYVDTSNFNSNRPMLSINERMGFELHEQFVFYKMRVKELEKRARGLS